jgi:two-component system chemotaxis sensor kinase CheA
MDQNALMKIFVAESEDLLANLEQGLMSLEADAADDETVHLIFRVAHTLKGNAGITGVEAVVSFAHVMEGVLDRVRARAVPVSHDLITLLLNACDALKDMVATVATGRAPTLTEEHQRVIDRFAPYLTSGLDVARVPPGPSGESASKRPPGPSVFDVQMRFREDLFATGQDPALLLQELAALGEVLELTADVSRVPTLDRLEATQCHLGWRMVLRTAASRADVEGVFLFVLDDNDIRIDDVTRAYAAPHAQREAEKKLGELLIEHGAVKPEDVREVVDAQRKVGELLVDAGKVKREELDKVLAKQEAARRARQQASIRVDTEKLDGLVNLVGELVICVAQVSQNAHDPATSREANVAAAELLMQITRDLQEQAMSLRMVPVRDSFDRFKRAARDVADQLGKLVIVEMAGTETELDKNVIEQLVDPLKHMIRNCISHGFESPAERVAAGKSDHGRVCLRASQREGRIVIEVADDGRGIDPEKVLAKARERGLVAPGQTLSTREIHELLFAPGFSTAGKIDEISGRGVGLDVVKRNVQELRGSVEIESEVGKGTTFRIRLPLTLAIIDGMTSKVGAETVTIPLLSVIELIEPAPGVIKTVAGKGELVDVRGELLPVVRLADVFEFPRGDAAKADAKVVVVENQGRKFGVMVDRVLGMDQAVVKPLDRSFALFNRLDRAYERPEGIAGATILGDGSIGLILDVHGIEQMAFREGPSARAGAAA